MISIEMVMLAGLGFLTAALLTVFLSPLYRRRVARLTTEFLKRSMPLTEAEIRADKDRLRAEYAIRIHKLEMTVEEAAEAAARQMVELNRRDAAITGLETEVSGQRTSLEEHENARRVLEQTIMDRLPKVEHRLAEARKLLFQRDREIVSLSQGSDKQARALEEATQINTQQTDEMHRLKAALNTRAARSREGLNDPRFEGEVALRTEIEALRSKTRNQAAQIARLEAMLTRAGPATELIGRARAGRGGERRARAEPAGQGRHEAHGNLLAASGIEGGRKPGARPQRRSTRRRRPSCAASRPSNQDQAADISRLKAALTTYEAVDKDERDDQGQQDRAEGAAERAQGAVRRAGRHDPGAAGRGRRRQRAAGAAGGLLHGRDAPLGRHACRRRAPRGGPRGGRARQAAARRSYQRSSRGAACARGQRER